MKKLTLLLFFATILMTTAFAQMNPVSWTYNAEKTGENEYNIVFKADVQDGWYIYSQFLGENGPIPTSFEFDNNAGIELVGKASEKGKKTESYDDIFEMDIVKFAGKTTFKQQVKTAGNPTKVTGYLTYMTCNDEGCLPPVDVDFAVKLD
ncbi:MAG: protein-disulfide reductase DsbD domain-containing protein [Saprospiraceae bacterium]